MTALLGASILVVGFLALFRVFDLFSKSRDVFALSRRAFADLSSPALDDDAKEKALRAHAAELFKLFVVLTLGTAAALMLPLLAVAALDRVGVLAFDDVMGATLSWEFLFGAAVVTPGVMWLLAVRSHRPRATEGDFENRYSRVDRLLHRFAFVTVPAQIAVADFEDRLFRASLAGIEVDRPVFITALPRAGTTLLLDLCAALDEFVTHTYRHMPFVPVPLLWERFARSFHTEDAPRERAHGDGMLVSFDSPEAFEEVLWLGFWKDHYRRDRIRPWTTEDHPDFVAFFCRHIRKLAVMQRARGRQGPARYVSKNNLNIARVGWLARAFPEARFLIPFRDPLQQAASLLRQHANFHAIHQADPFARRYMAAIGHFDFGANLRPIDFDGWIDRIPTADPMQINFWLAYWVACYRHLSVLAGERICFLSYEGFCASPKAGLERLAKVLDIEDRSRLQEQWSRIRSTPSHAVDRTGVNESLVVEAAALHARLTRLSLV